MSRLVGWLRKQVDRMCELGFECDLNDIGVITKLNW